MRNTTPPAKLTDTPQADSIELIAQELDEIRDLAVNGQNGVILAQQEYMHESRESHKQTQEMIVTLIRSVEKLSEENDLSAGRLAALERRKDVNGAAE